MHDPADTCAVCAEPLGSNGVATLECGHSFHCDCAVQWFRHNNTTCPLCRHEGVQTGWEMCDADRIAYMRCHGKQLPPHMRKQMRALDKFHARMREKRRERRRFEAEHRDTLKKHRRLHRAELRLSEFVDALTHEIASAPLSGVSYLVD